MNTTQYLTMADVARELGVSLLTVQRHIRAGRLSADKAPGRNGAVRISPAALARFRAQERALHATTVSTRTAATMLGVTTRTVQRLVASGQLATVEAPGSALRVTRASVTAHRRHLTRAAAA